MGSGYQSHALAYLPPGKISGTQCTGGSIGPRAGLEECGDKKISYFRRGSNSEPHIP